MAIQPSLSRARSPRRGQAELQAPRTAPVPHQPNYADPRLPPGTRCRTRAAVNQRPTAGVEGRQVRPRRAPAAVPHVSSPRRHTRAWSPCTARRFRRPQRAGWSTTAALRGGGDAVPAAASRRSPGVGRVPTACRCSPPCARRRSRTARSTACPARLSHGGGARSRPRVRGDRSGVATESGTARLALPPTTYELCVGWPASLTQPTWVPR
jgi:hypothetical protein